MQVPNSVPSNPLRSGKLRSLNILPSFPRLLLLVYQSIVQPIWLLCSTCFLTCLLSKRRSNSPCHKHSCQMNWWPHTHTVRAHSEGHLTHHTYNSTGQHPPTPWPLHRHALWTQVQVSGGQEGSLWQSLEPAAVAALDPRPR